MKYLKQTTISFVLQGCMTDTTKRNMSKKWEIGRTPKKNISNSGNRSSTLLGQDLFENGPSSFDSQVDRFARTVSNPADPDHLKSKFEEEEDASPSTSRIIAGKVKR